MPGLKSQDYRPRFKVEEIPTLGGDMNEGLAINARGWVVGESRTADYKMRGYVWDGKFVRALPLPPTYDQSCARGINARGDVIGDVWAANEGLSREEFLLSASGKVTLLDESHERYAHAIGDAGIVVGQSDAAACKWEGGHCQVLRGLGKSQSAAIAINSAGDIVATTVQEGNWQSFVWKAGRLKTLGTLGGHKTEATAANDNGIIVGIAASENGKPLAFKWVDGNTSTFGPAAALPHAVNGYGDVVGSYDITGWTWTTPSGGLSLKGYKPENTRAFLFTKGKFWDLNDLIEPSSEWKLRVATGINDKRQISGYGEYKGKTRAFRLTRER